MEKKSLTSTWKHNAEPSFILWMFRIPVTLGGSHHEPVGKKSDLWQKITIICHSDFSAPVTLRSCNGKMFSHPTPTVKPSLDAAPQQWILASLKRFITIQKVPGKLATTPIQSLVKLQPWFLSLQWKTCLQQNCSLGSCACSEGPVLGQKTLMIAHEIIINNQCWESFSSHIISCFINLIKRKVQITLK